MSLASPLLNSPAAARVGLFGMTIDALRMDQAVARLLLWIDSPVDRCRYVVTPNVDHVVVYQSSSDLRRAYGQADLVLADGAPVVAASRLLGRPLPERVAGSDLVPRLFDEATWQRRPLRVYILGGAPGVGLRAAERMGERWPAIEVVGVSAPPLGFDRDEAYNAALVDEINASQPDLLLVCLGAPKQERWIHAYQWRLQVPLALCVGATVDFLAGERRRAPVWMRRLGLEWLFRLLSEPRRLARRYARDAWRFPRLVWREWRDAAATVDH